MLHLGCSITLDPVAVDSSFWSLARAGYVLTNASIKAGIELGIPGVKSGRFSGSGLPEPGARNSKELTCALVTGGGFQSKGPCVVFSGATATQEVFVIAVEAPGASLQ